MASDRIMQSFEFNDFFDMHVPKILSRIFLYLEPPDLETAFIVCTQWRDFIRSHLLSNEVTLQRLLKNRRVHDWLNSEVCAVPLDYTGGSVFEDLDWQNVRGVYADRGQIFVYVVVQDKFHTDEKRHHLVVFDDAGGFVDRLSVDMPVAGLSFTRDRLLVHLSTAGASDVLVCPAAVFNRRGDEYEVARLYCPHLWRRYSICTGDNGDIFILGKRHEGDKGLVVLSSGPEKEDIRADADTEDRIQFAIFCHITPAGDHECTTVAEEHFLAAGGKVAVLLCRHGHVEVFDIVESGHATRFFQMHNPHFDLHVDPKTVTASFTPVVLRPKPGDVAHGLVRVFDHETGLALYDQEIADDAGFRMCVSDEYFVASHCGGLGPVGFVDVCHLGDEFALRRFDLPSADWALNSVQVLEDRLLLLCRRADEARASTSWGEVNVCDLSAQEIFLTFPSRRVLFPAAKLTGSRYSFSAVEAVGESAFVYQERGTEQVKLARFVHADGDDIYSME